MADRTHIEWTDATWNPVTGCTRISDGCTHCYIDRTPPFRMNGRKFNSPEIGATTGVQLHPERLAIPLRWQKPRRIFVCSLADLFHPEIPDDYIASVFAVMALAPQHTFQVLTKRHARLRSLLGSDGWGDLYDLALHRLMMSGEIGQGRCAGAPSMHGRHPLPNVWVGVSAENQQWWDVRVPILLDTPAAVRWVSAEPLLGPINMHAKDDGIRNILPDLEQDGDGFDRVVCTAHGVENCQRVQPHAGCSHLDWVVAGGESGPGTRTMHADWPRQIRDQCQESGVAFLFKQWGEHDAAGVRVGKKAAGRVLDGRTWDQYPGESR